MARSAIRGFATMRGWMATAGMGDHQSKPKSESTFIRHGPGGNLRARGIIRLTIDAHVVVFRE
jgi:hypothetical protein